MAEVLPLSDAELRILRSLAEHNVRFLIVGLSAAALQGAPVVTQDVDLWVEDLSDPRFREALRAVDATYVAPLLYNPPMIVGPDTEPFDIVVGMSGLRSFTEEYASSLEFPLGESRIRVLPLDRIVASKAAANRPKDQLVLPVLRDVLAAARAKRSNE